MRCKCALASECVSINDDQLPSLEARIMISMTGPSARRRSALSAGVDARVAFLLAFNGGRITPSNPTGISVASGSGSTKPCWAAMTIKTRRTRHMIQHTKIRMFALSKMSTDWLWMGNLDSYTHYTITTIVCEMINATYASVIRNNTPHRESHMCGLQQLPNTILPPKTYNRNASV